MLVIPEEIIKERRESNDAQTPVRLVALGGTGIGPVGSVFPTFPQLRVSGLRRGATEAAVLVRTTSLDDRPGSPHSLPSINEHRGGERRPGGGFR